MDVMSLHILCKVRFDSTIYDIVLDYIKKHSWNADVHVETRHDVKSILKSRIKFTDVRLALDLRK